MRRVTEGDIAEMRARGFEALIIEKACSDLERSKLADDLIDEIALAFKEVELGDGVGLFEAQGLDDYESGEVCDKYRESDEKLDWRKIAVDVLRRCQSSLSFFDEKGMTFHLPTFMTVELLG